MDGGRGDELKEGKFHVRKRLNYRLFGNTGHCAACSKTIPAFEMVMRARTNVYHLECFACQQCNHRYSINFYFVPYMCPLIIITIIIVVVIVKCESLLAAYMPISIHRTFEKSFKRCPQILYGLHKNLQPNGITGRAKAI